MRSTLLIVTCGLLAAMLVVAIYLQWPHVVVVAIGLVLGGIATLALTFGRIDQEKIRRFGDSEREATDLAASLDSACAKADEAIYDLKIATDRIRDQDLVLSQQREELARVATKCDPEASELQRTRNTLSRLEQELKTLSASTSKQTAKWKDDIVILASRVSGQMQQAESLERQIDGAGDASTISSLLNDTLQLLHAVTSTVDVKTSKTQQYSDSVEVILESTATMNLITEDIQYIADQTSLLSLKAAIETARAGEHGAGFSSVAEDVRKLSDRTNQASTDIVRIVTNVNSAIGDMSASLKTSSDATAEGTNFMVTIRNLVEQAVQAKQLFAQQLEKTIEEGRGISENLEELKRSVEQQHQQEKLDHLIHEVVRMKNLKALPSGDANSQSVA